MTLKDPENTTSLAIRRDEILRRPDMATAVRNIAAQIEADPAQLATAIQLRAKDLYTSRLHGTHYRKLVGTGAKSTELVCIGPGGHFHDRWTTVDKLYGDKSWSNVRRGTQNFQPDIVWDALELGPLPLPDQSVSRLYCAHVIEHLSEEAVQNLLREARRVLRPDGIFRVTCPDARLFFSAYDRADWSFFIEHEMAMAKRLRAQTFEAMDEAARREFSAWTLLHTMSLITHEENSQTLEFGACAAYIEAHGGAEAAVSQACAESDLALNRSLGWHISWWDWPKLQHAIATAGFTDINRSGYLQSTCPKFRHPLVFDRTDPHQTLYAEAGT